MQIVSAWILAMSSILYHQVICSSEYQVFHTGLTSDPAVYHDDYQHHDSDKKQEFDLSGFKKISPTPKFTLSHLYVSPENAEPHFTRSVSQSKDGYGDGYTAFLQQHFQENDGDDEVNSKYRHQNHDDDDDEVNSEYRQQDYDNGEDGEANSKHRQESEVSDDDEEVNSKYRQNNYDDGEEEVKSNYEYAPKQVEESDHHYYNNRYNGDGFDRIQSLPLKASNQDGMICKVIVKGKAMCRLCKDPFSGAHSESCTFSSAPPEHKYSYSKKEKYVG